ncbi:MAG: hypothetical protein NTZ67_02960 [Gammaproteobacteria bacterium]|nr:hypothetical protein [Gammaproteobacteria bacterium]
MQSAIKSAVELNDSVKLIAILDYIITSNNEMRSPNPGKTDLVSETMLIEILNKPKSNVSYLPILFDKLNPDQSMISYACAALLMRARINIDSDLLKKASIALVLHALVAYGASVEVVKLFLDHNSEKLNQEMLTTAVYNPYENCNKFYYSPKSETISFLCSLTTEYMPELTKPRFAGYGYLSQKNFVIPRSPLTNLKQSSMQKLLDYINSLGELSGVAKTQFTAGLFTRVVRNQKLSEKKVAHARTLIKNIGNCPDAREIKFLLVSAQIQNKVEFELFRTSGKSRYDTCLEKLISAVSDQQEKSPGLST